MVGISEYKKKDLGTPNGFSRIIAADKSLIIYRPKLNTITGSVLATILLQQITYWAERNNNDFYKFTSPCNHELYKNGDSWCEELGFSKAEFSTALKKIGFKLGKNKEKNLMNRDDAFVIYYTDNKRLTHYSVNWNKLNESFNEVYLVSEESGFTKESKERLPTKENAKTNITKESRDNGVTFNSEITTDITTKTTQISSEEEKIYLKFKNSTKNNQITISQKEKLKEFISTYTAELVLKAIDETIMRASIFNLNYLETLLKDWKDKGIQTVNEVDNALKSSAYNSKKSIQTKESTFNNFEQRTYDFEDLEKKLLGIE